MSNQQRAGLERAIGQLENQRTTLRAERDEAIAILRRFVNFSKEMPQDIVTCLDMGNRIAADAEAFLKRSIKKQCRGHPQPLDKF